MIYAPPYTASQLRWEFELRDLLILDHARARAVQLREDGF